MKTSQSCCEVLARERFRSGEAAQNKLFAQQRQQFEPSLSSNARGSRLQGFSKVSVAQHSPGEAARAQLQAPPCAHGSVRVGPISLSF